MKVVKIVSTKQPNKGKLIPHYDVGVTLTNLIEMEKRGLEKLWKNVSIISATTTASDLTWATTLIFDVQQKQE